MVNILFITDLNVGSHIAQLDGIFSRAAQYGWHVIEIENMHPSRPLRDYLQYWKPAGCIVESAAISTLELSKKTSGTPIVFLDPTETILKQHRYCVSTDSAQIAHCAVQELENLPLRSYGFVGWCEATLWSESRRKAFEAELAEKNVPLYTLCVPWESGDSLRYQKKLTTWLKRLPKPAGIFAANDATAIQVLDACHALDLSCPQEVSVIGADNLIPFCENAITSLSSIEINFKDAGARAADLLAQVIENPALPSTHLTYGVKQIVRRQSTRYLHSTDKRVLRAVETIRREAVLGLKAAEVIRQTGLSRRAIEKKFRAATGKTILQEIYDIRFQNVFHLLADTLTPLSHIAEACGWESDVFLRRAFKKRTGMTMREWRNRAR